MQCFQHGEGFVTDDGAEAGLDLGHYERFTTAHMSMRNNWTQGRIYQAIIDSERRGDYLGKAIQIIPHVTNQIKDAIKAGISDATAPGVIIVEIGGTVGDIESRTRNNADTTKLSTQKTRNLLFVRSQPLKAHDIF